MIDDTHLVMAERAWGGGRSVDQRRAEWPDRIRVCDRLHHTLKTNPQEAPVDTAAPPVTRRRLTAIDLFGGVGGLSLGFEQAGFDVLAALEYDPVHAATHAFNFPLTKVLCRDARRVTGEELLAGARQGWRRHRPTGPAWDGVVDAVIGGPSCQGFSVMGRKQRDDERNDLLLEFARLVVEIRPRTVCLENVPGLLLPQFDDVRDRAFGLLRDAGYNLSPTDAILNAAHYGVPQNRKRVVVFGVLDGTAPSLPAPVGLQVTVGEALDGLPNPLSYPGLLDKDTAQLRHADLARREKTESTYARVLAGLDHDPQDRSRRRDWDPAVLTCSLVTVHSQESRERFAATLPGTEESISRSFRLRSDGLARTLRAGTGSERGSFSSPRPLHPTQPRVITAREAARLHSYPDWFRFNGTNWHSHRQIGNSVPPLLARALGQALATALNARPQRATATVALGDEGLLYLPRAEAVTALGGVAEELPPMRQRQEKRRPRKQPAGERLDGRLAQAS
ncbi:DNA cytosine methyltransferase [Dactylosporangium sp. NPDC049742]|uniref:DNA cytosine methyltransferase n=1 Tax=Dactylosporangium sp. NPDC049742 TaxID=3154737 RepID=UPI003435C00F